jgi:3-oxoisoapionate decarboxylase
MKLGIGTYTFMWSIGFEGARPPEPMTPRGLAEKAAELGVRLVQFGPNLTFTLEDLAPARDLGLEIEIGAASLDIAPAIALTRAAGGCFLRTVLQEDAVNVPPPSRIEAGLRALLPALDDLQVDLGLENSVVPAATLRAILESIGSPRLGITLDTANSLAIGESWRHVLAELAPYTFCLHLKDFKVRREWHRMGFRIEGAPATQGDVDVPYLLNVLNQAGNCRSAVVELWPPEQRTLAETIALEHQWARASIAHLRALIPD